MAVKIAKWLALILTLKLAAVLVVAQFDPDPRKNIEARSKLCKTFRPNVVFVGTSRTLFGINPQLFDSLNHGQTRSYNFGIFSLPAAAAFEIANELILEDTAVKTIYLELSALDYSTVTLTPATFYHDIAFRANVMSGATKVTDSQKLNSFFAGLNTSLFQLFSIAPEITLVRKFFSPGSDPIEGKPALQPNGYQPVARSLYEVDAAILKNEQATRQMLAANAHSVPNTFYISKINELIALAAKMKKTLILFYPNNLTKNEYLVLSEVAPYLAEKNLIKLPAGPQFDAFFKPENLFDPHHLNQQGAAVYTQFLQKESLIRLQKADH